MTSRVEQFKKELAQRSMQPAQVEAPVQQKKEGFLKSALKELTSPFVRMGATFDALGTSKILGGQGANFETKKTPVGDINPIRSAKDAAGVTLELGATGLGFKGVGTAGKFAARFLKTGALGATFGTGQALQQKNSSAKDVIKGAATGAAVGAALPVAGEAVKLAKRFLGVVGKGAAASVSGVGSDVIDTVIQNPKAARAGMRGDATKVLGDLAKEVRTKVSNLSREASDAYGDALEALPKRLGRAPQVLSAGQKTAIKVDGKTYTLSMQGVKSKLTSSLREFDVIVNPKKKSFDFLESPFRRSEENVLREVFDVIDNWRDTSPKGLNSLAKKIGNYRKAGEQSAELNSVIDAVKSNVRSYIGERIPAAKTLNARYARVKDFTKAIDQELATSGAYKGGTAEQLKTAKRIATIFNKNKELARELVERLEGGRDILAKEAGRELNAGTSRSTASIGDTVRSAIQTVIPPRVVGEIAAQTGIAQQNLVPILESLRKLNPATRTLLVKLLSGASGDGQSTEPEDETETLFQAR